MTEKIITTLYRYKLEYTDAFAVLNIPGEYIDNLIGGAPLEINGLEVIFHIYDVADESVFNHPWVIWWDKKVIENEITLTKLPTKNARNVNWKSRNRGGGVKHKNFDKTDAKLYYKETEKPTKKLNKPIPKTIIEPPGGIMGIFKNEN
jgi:hypothetical protein